MKISGICRLNFHSTGACKRIFLDKKSEGEILFYGQIWFQLSVAPQPIGKDLAMESIFDLGTQNSENWRG